jgi:hypothetical protein
MLLPDLAREIEEESAFDATLTHATPGFLGLDLIQSEKQRTRLPLGLHNVASVYQGAYGSSLFSHWRRTWIIFTRSEEEPPLAGGRPR